MSKADKRQKALEKRLRDKQEADRLMAKNRREYITALRSARYYHLKREAGILLEGRPNATR